MALRFPLRVIVLVSCSLAACGVTPEGDLHEGEAALSVCARGAMTKGIDVSHWEGTIDWALVKADGVEFAYMKATEGTGFVDSTFARNWAQSAQHGVLRGAYHFFRPAVDAVAQADFFIDTAGVPQAGDLPLVIDLEVTDSLSGARVAAAALRFLQRVEERTGQKAAIYTSARVFDSLLGTPAGFGGYPLWDANWGVTCPNIPSPTWSTWTFWQYSATGSVRGVTGNIDMNHFNGTLAELQQLVDRLHADGGVARDGGLADGGATVDGGRVTDGGHADAGSPRDGGAAPDAGARQDGGGVAADAGAGDDAGVMGGTDDAGATNDDAGVASDAGRVQDAGGGSADGGLVSPHLAGGCSAAGGGPASTSGVLFALGLLAIAFTRGRARQRRELSYASATPSYPDARSATVTPPPDGRLRALRGR